MTLEIANFWAPARADVAHVCFTLNDAGLAGAYMNGESKGSSENNALPNIVTRANMFIGKSNWPDEGRRQRVGDVRFCCRSENSSHASDPYQLNMRLSTSFASTSTLSPLKKSRRSTRR